MSIKRVLLSIICIIFTIIIAGCEKSDKNYDKITNFTYNYGSYNGGYYEYNIKKKKKKNIFTAKGYNGVNLNINKEIDEYYLEQLSKIIKETDIESWNGFNKKDNKILDGYSFNLKVEYKNGKTINASGYMKYPKNYKNTHKKIVKFLKSIK